MKEYKFRGKDKLTGKWLYGSLIIEDKKYFIFYVTEFGSTSTEEVYPETVGQYIGLPDKNKKEIYEGDIISFRHRRSEELTNLFPPEEIKDITNMPIQVCMSVTCQGNSKEPDGDIEVIGNVSENPELRKLDKEL